MNDLPARIDPEEAEIGRPTATARHLVEASVSENTPPRLRRGCFRAKLAGQPAPAGERTARVLAGYRRTTGERGRGQARPRRRGRGGESDQVAL